MYSEINFFCSENASLFCFNTLDFNSIRTLYSKNLLYVDIDDSEYLEKKFSTISKDKLIIAVIL